MIAAASAAVVPLGHLIFQPRDLEPWVGLAATFFVFAVSLFIRKSARRASPPPFLGFISAVVDVSLVSAIHVSFLVGGQPFAAVSGRVYFGAYLLVISLSCLRLDVRICLLSGITAVVQYVAIVMYASRLISISGMTSHPTYGSFRWDNQASRVVLLAIATATAIVIVAQSSKLVAASLQDSLTGLPNRRYALARLDDALAASRRLKRQVVVALADVDHFKSINDRYGHTIGDEVLVEVGLACRNFCREMDCVARYGGEEFLIILVESKPDGAFARLEELTQICVHPAGNSVPEIAVTFSIGVASWPEDGETAAELVDVADRRLYLAKDKGRGRIEFGSAAYSELRGA